MAEAASEVKTVVSETKCKNADGEEPVTRNGGGLRAETKAVEGKGNLPFNEDTKPKNVADMDSTAVKVTGDIDNSKGDAQEPDRIMEEAKVEVNRESIRNTNIREPGKGTDLGRSEGKKNGTSNVYHQDTNALKKAVKRQLEYYFGDFNLPKDKFLLNNVKESDGGWIALETMLKFNRLANITTDKSLILEALECSELLEVDARKEVIRRLPSLPVPEFNEEWKKAKIEKTVYCKGFEKEETTMTDLIKFFEGCENVANVMKRTYGKNRNEQFFKGSVFVTFETREDAEKFIKLDSVKNPEGDELIRKWQRDYFDEKDKAFEERRAGRQEQKRNNKKAKETLAKAMESPKENEEIALPTGAILCLLGIKNENTKLEDIRDAFLHKFQVDRSSVAFIFFNKGDTEAKLRFKEENAAKNLFENMVTDGEKLKINDDELELKVLDGQEEADFLEQCKSDIANYRRKGQSFKRGRKRHGGGGGSQRGGKRRRAE